MRGPNRQRKRGRRAPFRTPRPIILIVCEGAVTEKQYFEKFANHKKSLIKVQIAKETGEPLSLVEYAITCKVQSHDRARRHGDANLEFESVWCVFDVDEHHRLDEAKAMAAGNGIELAISNPCFELWLILHHRDNPGMHGRRYMQNLLSEYIPRYNKHVDFAQYAPGYTEAVKRAKRLDEVARQAGTPGHNPTTNVYELTELIDPQGEER